MLRPAKLVVPAAAAIPTAAAAASLLPGRTACGLVLAGSHASRLLCHLAGVSSTKDAGIPALEPAHHLPG